MNCNANKHGQPVINYDGHEIHATLYPGYWLLQTLVDGVTYSRKYSKETIDITKQFLTDIGDN